LPSRAASCVAVGADSFVEVKFAEMERGGNFASGSAAARKDGGVLPDRGQLLDHTLVVRAYR